MNMASNSAVITLVLLAALFAQPTTILGEIRCENLDKNTCSYAISSSGKRCVLEKHTSVRSRRSGAGAGAGAEAEAFTCRTSDIEAERLRNWIETEECIKACGLDRFSLGISSDSLLDSRFTHNLCSPPCYHACPNIVDLYFNLAAAEGVFLPKLCEAREGNARRELAADMRSSGFVAPGPVMLNPVDHKGAPAPLQPVRFTTIAPASPPYY